MSPPSDLESASDDLYAVAPEDFVARRKELVAQARAAKDRALATAIGGLRRPTKSGWLVNRLARDRPDEIDAFLALGTALQEAQSGRDGAAVRRLSQERHDRIATLLAAAASCVEDQGQPITDAQRQEITQTLQSALADPEAAELVRRGRVVQPIAYGGFGVWGSAASSPVASDDAHPDALVDAPGSAAGSADSPDRPAPTEPAGPTEADLTAARDAAEQAQAALEQRQAARDSAEARRDELAAEIDTLTTRLAELSTAYDEAGDELEAAESALDQATTDADRATAALAELGGSGR